MPLNWWRIRFVMQTGLADKLVFIANWFTLQTYRRRVAVACLYVSGIQSTIRQYLTMAIFYCSVDLSPFISMLSCQYCYCIQWWLFAPDMIILPYYLWPYVEVAVGSMGNDLASYKVPSIT